MNPINIYQIVGPIVLVCILLEWAYCMVKKNGYYSFQDSVIGIGTMVTAQCVNIYVAFLVIKSYGWVYNHMALSHIEPSWYNYILCYLGVDFLFYWFHRAGHRVNVLWAAHVPHHSAEELNYAVALRASLTQRAASFLFYWPLAVIGFSPTIIIPVVALNLVLQFLPHTRVIPKLPTWIDSWLNTPWHHRIHHAANVIYWDRNYGGTFIIWDKMFETYREETEEPYYGVAIHPRSWDPTYLNLHWFLHIVDDTKKAPFFIDKIKVWFMPPGWRPRGLPEYEKPDAVTARNQVKYKSVPTPGSHAYIIGQIPSVMVILFWFSRAGSPLSGWEQFTLSFLLWIAVTIWAGFFESKRWAMPLEVARLLLTTIALIAIFQKHGMNQDLTRTAMGVCVFYLGWLGFFVGHRKGHKAGLTPSPS